MAKKGKTNKNVVIIMLIILLLALAVGYAAFSDILTISGTANAKGTFDLEFQNAEVVKLVGAKEEGTTAEISQDKNTLTVNVADLAYPGAGVEFSVDIVNVGTIPAEVNAVNATAITGSEHIKVTGLEAITTNHETIGVGDKCNIHFTVEWPKEMTEQIAENEVATFELNIEYTQATGEDFNGQALHTDTVGNTAGGEVVEPEAKTLVSQITGADYGKAINYKATVQGQEVSNWKVFHNDGKNVYIILDDYLPSNLVPASAGLQTTDTYSVYSNIDRDTLLKGLTTESYWNEFAGGVEGATATGGATNTQFVASWNNNPAVNERQIEEGKNYFDGSPDGEKLIDPTKLYIPQITLVDNNNCSGYWLTSINAIYNFSIWYVNYDDNVNDCSYNYTIYGVRPVVCLPSNITGTVGDTVEI